MAINTPQSSLIDERLLPKNNNKIKESINIWFNTEEERELFFEVLRISLRGIELSRDVIKEPKYDKQIDILTRILEDYGYHNGN